MAALYAIFTVVGWAWLVVVAAAAYVTWRRRRDAARKGFAVVQGPDDPQH
jgi:hypothetical protein